MRSGPLLAAALAVPALLGGCASSPSCGPETVVILARHADRVEGTDSLMPAGVRRSQELAHALGKAGVTAIVTSDAGRAKQTAAPLVAATGLTPIELKGSDIDAFVREVGGHRGGTVLVVGHSNTVPKIVAGLGGPQLPDIDAAEFDNLFVLTLPGCGPARLVSLQYGDASPRAQP
jgi:broad specificity phosphatase PhoE